MFRSPVNRCVSMAPLAKATDEGRQRAPLQSSRFLSETPSPLRFGTLILYRIAVNCFVRRSTDAFPWHCWRRRPMRGASARPFKPRAFYPRCHLRSGLVSPIPGAPNSVTTSLSCRLSLRPLKLKPGHAFCFDVDLSGTLFFSRKEECRLGFADKDVGERTEEPGWRLPFVPLRPE